MKIEIFYSFSWNVFLKKNIVKLDFVNLKILNPWKVQDPLTQKLKDTTKLKISRYIFKNKKKNAR